MTGMVLKELTKNIKSNELADTAKLGDHKKKGKYIMNITDAKNYILNRIDREGNPELYYHNLDHTLDVYNSSITIATKEGVNGRDMDLLKTAALYHDSGMLKTYKNHEEASLEIIEQVLPRFGYTREDIDVIGKIIMTTKLPQNAKTFLEKIICDADLDYLGRKDFFMISHRLRQEWIGLDYLDTTLKEWYHLQVAFLHEHEYYTKTARDLRMEVKKNNLEQILELLNQNLKK